MASIFKVMLRCPVTGEELDTGMRTSGREALNSSVYQDGRVDCPYCKQFHTFEGNAYLETASVTGAGSLWRPNP